MTALLSSVDLVMRDGLATDPHIIPPITDPMGRNWKQPDRRDIEIDDKHALMSAAALEKLADYTQSQPTGVYPGKMWKAMSARKSITCAACGAKSDSGLIWLGWVPNRLWIEVYCKACGCHWCEQPVWFLKWFGAEFIHPKDGRCVSNHSREILIA